MREALLNSLMCLRCRKSAFKLQKGNADDLELVEGAVLCEDCGASYRIKNGIVDFLDGNSLSISREIEAMDNEEYIKDESGNRYKITDEVVENFKDKFLSLPEGDNSSFFKKGGCFRSIRDTSQRFYRALEDISLTGTEAVLEIGAAFSWASYRFAKRGCKVVALDISNYLRASRVYLRDAYFDRVFADMHNIPFEDNTFDIVFGSAVMHHTGKLEKGFSEIYRVLKKGGRFVLINESARGIFERMHPDLKILREKGYQDTSYTIPQWKRGAREGGFGRLKIEYLSPADDYIMRHEGREDKLKLKAAYFIKRHPLLEGFLLYLSNYPRVLFRPKSWRMFCYK